MSDLIERLRETKFHGNTGIRGADLIEAQQAEIAQLKSQYSDVNEQLFSASLAYENEHIEKSDLEAEIARLREALICLRDCDWVISLPDRMDAVRGIARKALEQRQ